jgi:hypothetical protein
VWLNQGVHNENVFLNFFVNRVKDISLQEWNMNVDDNSKLESYKLFKNGFSFEHYLNVLDLKKIRFIYTIFRIGSLDIEVERGRYTHTPRNERICKVYDKNSTENQNHFLLVCDCYDDLRNNYLPKKYYMQPNLNKFNIIMSTTNEYLIKSFAVFLYYAYEKRKQYLQNI